MGLLLAVDVGNTHAVVGLYEGDQLTRSFRLHTDKNKTVDEYGVMVRMLLKEHDYRLGDLDGVVISNVVPMMTETLEQVAKEYLHCEPLFVNHKLDLGFTIAVDNPEEAGADLLAGCAGALEVTEEEFVVVADLGTATTLSVMVNKELIGVSIAPGLAISLDAILRRAPHLPPFRLEPPPKAYGDNTIHCLQSGLVLGHACMIDGLVQRIEEEVGKKPATVVVTGGLATSLEDVSRTISVIRPNLVLEGIRQIWLRNR